MAGPIATMARTGLTRGFGNRSVTRSGIDPPRQHRTLSESDMAAIARAQMLRALDGLLQSGMARLRLHYAARLAGVMVLSRRDRPAAIAALIGEREAALARLREEIAQSRTSHLARLRRSRRLPDRPKRSFAPIRTTRGYDPR